MSKLPKAVPQTTRIPFWATLLTLLGLCILIGLGTWQLQRLAWKKDIITKIKTAYATEDPQNLDLNQSPAEYSYGPITGHFLADKAFLLGPPQIKEEQPGYNLIVPLKTDTYTLLINMGWTPYTLEKQPIYHLDGQNITFNGLLKTPRWNAFTPPNNPKANIWFRLDTSQIAKSKNLKNLYPEYLLADKANYKFDAAFFNDKAQNRPLPNNNHLQYALFWFTMAAGLLTIYILRFIIKRK